MSFTTFHFWIYCELFQRSFLAPFNFWPSIIWRGRLKVVCKLLWRLPHYTSCLLEWTLWSLKLLLYFLERPLRRSHHFWWAIHIYCVNLMNLFLLWFKSNLLMFGRLAKSLRRWRWIPLVRRGCEINKIISSMGWANEHRIVFFHIDVLNFEDYFIQILITIKSIIRCKEKKKKLIKIF